MSGQVHEGGCVCGDVRYIYVRSHQDWTRIPKGEAIYEGTLPTDVTQPPPNRK